MNIEQFCQEIGGDNFQIQYKLLEETPEFKLYYLYEFPKLQGTLGKPILAVEYDGNCRFCNNSEYHTYYSKFKDIFL